MGSMIHSRRRSGGSWRRRLVASARRVAVVVTAIIAVYVALLLKPEVLLAHEVRVQNLALHASTPLTGVTCGALVYFIAHELVHTMVATWLGSKPSSRAKRALK
jgi:hypothetical protein